MVSPAINNPRESKSNTLKNVKKIQYLHGILLSQGSWCHLPYYNAQKSLEWHPSKILFCFWPYICAWSNRFNAKPGVMIYIISSAILITSHFPARRKRLLMMLPSRNWSPWRLTISHRGSWTIRCCPSGRRRSSTIGEAHSRHVGYGR